MQPRLTALWALPLFCLPLLGCQKESAASSTPETSTSAEDKSCCSEDAPEATPLPDESLYLLESEWTDQNGKTRRLEDFRGGVTVEAMIFTNCSYACPRILADLKAIEALVPAADLPRVEWLLISMDSERDTPEVLAAYAQEQELDLSRWTLLHGDASAVREVGAVTGVSYKQAPNGDFSHSNVINVLDREGRIQHQLEGLGVDPAKGAAAIAEVLKP